MKLENPILKDVLVKSGIVSEKDFDDAANSAAFLGKPIEEVLVFRGLITEDAIAKLISEYLGVPFVDISKYQIPDEVLNKIPEKLARTYRMVPFALDGNQLKVAMEDPKDFEALEFARRNTNLQIIPHYSSKDTIRKALSEYKKDIHQDFDRVIAENIKKASTDENPLKAAEDVPVIKVLDTIMAYAVGERASDIHIETLESEVVIRFRIDGVLKDIITLPRGIESALTARIKILSNLKIDEHRIPQDGRIKFTFDEDIIGLRVSIIPGFYAENVVMRLLPESSRPLSLEELGVVGYNLDLIKDAIKRPYGMILVTGPTGSGKTTTLYSVLNILNTSKVKICTIEDPVEYGIKRITQIQVNSVSGLTFAAGLRALLRHNPDIIMVGEIRDEETAEVAVHSAMTGHLVLSTLHTNTAAGAIPRFMDMGVEGYLLASTVNVILAQRLVRSICSNCIAEYSHDPEFVAKLSKETGIDLTNQKFYKGQGCEECHHTGYHGRIGIYEVLPITQTIRRLVIQKASSDQIQDQAIQEGMITMLRDAINKVAAGKTTIEEALRAIRE